MNCNKQGHANAALTCHVCFMELEAENAKLHAEVKRLKGPLTCRHDPQFAGGACAVCHAEWIQKAKGLEDHNDRLRNALIKIATYGRVCAEFETCDHPACCDSAGAALLAMEVLKGGAVPIRPELLKFAEAMEVVLQENDYKGSVTTVPCDVAVERLWDEMRELDRAAWGHISIITQSGERKRIQKEAVDVANFALMAWYGAQK